ncbi:ComF family protein [Isobaculum melis]|uniref:Competence protein ComFC n=1 Tax=Isobaculum melis TaxID=142588 RepID=A0A1H9QN04_9LACT|nr:ComF family protein [Isobaculum melis]SER61818.1 competence protein ComFC [Isobaculum melis]
MTTCLWCQQPMIHVLDLKWFFSLKPIAPYLVCATCQKQVSKLSEVTCCSGCGQAASSTALCKECQVWQEKYPHHFLSHQALYQYNDFFKEWMKQYKFQGIFHLRMMFAEDLRKQLKKYHHYTIVPIPISEERLQERGYNQVSALLDAAKMPYTPLLKKEVHSERQSSKSKKQRLETQQPFCVRQELVQQIEGQAILIVDDIYTTGSTLRHAYQCLDELGVKVIKTLTLAR